MEELIKKVEERTGLSESQARAAAQAVIDILESELPTSASNTIKVVMQGDSSEEAEIRELGLFNIP